MRIQVHSTLDSCFKRTLITRKTSTMQQVGVFLLLIATVLCSAEWFRINSTCFQVDEKNVTQSGALKLCRERDAILHSVENETELENLTTFIPESSAYWIAAKNNASGLKCDDGRGCYPKKWWWPDAPDDEGSCAQLRKRNTVFLWDAPCGDAYKFLCSKPADMLEPICPAEWFRINSTCFKSYQEPVEQSRAIESCKTKDAFLHTVQNEAELEALRTFINDLDGYWVSGENTPSGFKCNDESDCYPKSWWWPDAPDELDEPGGGDRCAQLRKKSKMLLWNASCDHEYAFLCSKPAVGKWTLVKCEEYYWSDLCGVAIMPNCDGRSCEEVCDSHPDCNQFAKISNLCINIKNDAPLNECVIKMRSTVELYKRSESEFYCK